MKSCRRSSADGGGDAHPRRQRHPLAVKRHTGIHHYRRALQNGNHQSMGDGLTLTIHHYRRALQNGNHQSMGDGLTLTIHHYRRALQNGNHQSMGDGLTLLNSR